MDKSIKKKWEAYDYIMLAGLTAAVTVGFYILLFCLY